MSSRLLRAMAESVWTAEEAIAWAEGLSRWTTRRYRLEGSRAGNSRLVTLWHVKALKAEYGGEIVELIPPKGPPALSANQERAVGLDACPHCGVEPNDPCVAPRGAMVPPHVKREVKQLA